MFFWYFVNAESVKESKKQGLLVIPGDVIHIGHPVFILKVKRPDEAKKGFEIYQKGTLAIQHIDLRDAYYGALSTAISPEKFYRWEKLGEEMYKKVLAELAERLHDAQADLLIFKTVKVMRYGNAVG